MHRTHRPCVRRLWPKPRRRDHSHCWETLVALVKAFAAVGSMRRRRPLSLPCRIPERQVCLKALPHPRRPSWKLERVVKEVQQALIVLIGPVDQVQNISWPSRPRPLMRRRVAKRSSPTSSTCDWLWVAIGRCSTAPDSWRFRIVTGRTSDTGDYRLIHSHPGRRRGRFR